MDAPTQPGYEVVPSRFDYPNSRVRNRPRQHGFGTKIRREGRYLLPPKSPPRFSGRANPGGGVVGR
jgi:hypothetical protein